MDTLSSLQESVQAMEERNQEKRDMIQQIRQDIASLNQENDRIRSELHVRHSRHIPQNQHPAELLQEQNPLEFSQAQLFQPQPPKNTAESTNLAEAKAGFQSKKETQEYSEAPQEPAVPQQKEATQPLTLSQNASHSEILCFVEQFLRQKQQERKTVWQPQVPNLPPQVQAQLSQTQNGINVGEASLTNAQVEGLQRRAVLLRQLAERIASQPRNPRTPSLLGTQSTRKESMPEEGANGKLGPVSQQESFSRTFPPQVLQAPHQTNSQHPQYNLYQAPQNPQLQQPTGSDPSRASIPTLAQPLTDRNRAAVLLLIFTLMQRSANNHSA